MGARWIIGEDTGQVAFIELAGIIFCIMLVANFLLPLLTDFGFLTSSVRCWNACFIEFSACRGGRRSTP